MNNTNGHLYLNQSSLDEIIDYMSRRTVGRVLKRIEIHQNIEVLKKEVKELLYEQFRDTGDLIYTAGKGVDPITKINFNKKADS